PLGFRDEGRLEMFKFALTYGLDGSGMSNVEMLLREIRDELREIKLLYKGLVEKLIPTEEPSSDEREAIESDDEVVDEIELMEALK
ncbi:MAG: hypothetical protein QXV77_07720, partial [Candidatus Bathyarchaeia archaeon]